MSLYSSNSINMQSLMPQLASMMTMLMREIGTFMHNPQFSGGMNMGPSMDTMTPSNNLFSGSLPPSCSPYGSPAPSPSPYPGSYGSPPAASAPAPSTVPAASPSGAMPTPSPTSSTGSGGDYSYANNMLNVLQSMNAPPDLINAYRAQYQLLGLLPSGGDSTGGTPSPSGTPSTSPSPEYSPSPSAYTPTPAPAPSGGSPSASPGQFYQTPSPGPSASPSASPGPSASPSPAAPSPGPASSPASSGQSSPEFMGSGKVDWNSAPAALKQLQPYIQHAASVTGTPESIIAAAIWKESGGNIGAAGGDPGLMQIDPNTYSSEIAGKNGLPAGSTPTDPANNIMAGATYIGMMKQKFGTWDLALRGYNSGENGVDVNDPNARPKGGGDAQYVILLKQYVKDLETGAKLPYS